MKHRLLKRIVGVGAVRVAAAFFTFLFNVLVARQLGASDSGVFFLAFSIVSALSVISRLGLDNVLLRRFSAYWKAEDVESATGVWRIIAIDVAIASILVTLCTYFSVNVLERFFEVSGLANTLAGLSIAIFPLAFTWLLGALVQSVGLNVFQVAFQTMLIPMFVCLAMLLLPLDIESVALMWMKFSYLVMLIALLLVSLRIKFSGRIKFRRGDIYEESLPMWWMQFLKMFQQWGMPIFLALFVSSSEIAWFHVSTRLTMLIGVVLLVVSNVLAPNFSHLYAEGRFEELEALAKKSVRYLIVLSGPMIFICLFFPHYLLGLFGAEFVAAKDVFRILIVGQVVNVATGSVGYLLMMTNHGRKVASTATANIIILLVSGAVFVPMYGVYAAAIVVSVSMSITNLLNVYWVKKYLGFNILVFWRGG